MNEARFWTGMALLSDPEMATLTSPVAGFAISLIGFALMLSFAGDTHVLVRGLR